MPINFSNVKMFFIYPNPKHANTGEMVTLHNVFNDIIENIAITANSHVVIFNI